PLLAVARAVRSGGFALQSLSGAEHLRLGARLRAREHAVQRFRRGAVVVRLRHPVLFFDVICSGRLNLSPAVRYARCMPSDHYFSAAPASAENLRTIRVTLAG